MAVEIKFIQGATHTGLRITFLDENASAYDLTGATMSARIKNISTGGATAATGTFSLVTASSGIFTYIPSTADVATAGVYKIQFIATYSDTSKDKTFVVPMQVYEAI